MKAYFNLVYSRIYDFTTSANAAYIKQQEKCIEKLEPGDNEKLLCIGVGTGNELRRIIDKYPTVNITAIDQSITALNRARKKIARTKGNIELRLTDARKLEFEDKSFDRVLCIHVMEFIRESRQATNEILRVLKNGGRFVITYPTSMEGARLGFNLFISNLQVKNLSLLKRFVLIIKSISRLLVGLLYIPLLFRKKRNPYSKSELEQIFGNVTDGNFFIEEDKTYQDFIVYGDKIKTEAVDA